MYQELKSKLGWWKLKAERIKNNDWVKFALYWMMLDAYLTEGSQKWRDDEKLDWFINQDNELKSSLSSFWRAPQNQVCLNSLKSLSPIKDMRPGFRREVELEDVSNYGEVFRFIYQVRCNLFHGAKDATSDRDSNLVSHSCAIIGKSIRWWLMSD